MNLFKKKDKKEESEQSNKNNDLQQIFRNIFERNLQLLSEEFKAEEMNKLFQDNGNYIIKYIGGVNINSGCVEVGDPLCYLGTQCALQLKTQINSGKYPVLISIFSHDIFGLRYLAAKMQITDKSPVKYEEALPKQDSGLNFFGVETGLACFCDLETEKEYVRFLDKWHTEHPDKNHYDDYFAALFAESARKEPEYQRNDGDYLDWYLPDNDKCNIVMFCSGFGDGAYVPYWGYDEDGAVCCLILRFIDPKAFDILN
ncbi:MAG: DUF4241 domain-containing protein [Aminipila sp.]